MGILAQALLLPPGINFVLLALGLAAHHWWTWTGRVLVALSLVALLAFSAQIVGRRLLRSIEDVPTFNPELLGAQPRGVIVVLGAGRHRAAPEYQLEDTPNALTLERLRYAAHLARRLKLPLLVAGGRHDNEGTAEAVLMNQVLIEDFNVQVRYLETRSRNAKQVARWVMQRIFALHRQVPHRDGAVETTPFNVILVTHAWQMQRMMALFSAQLSAHYTRIPRPPKPPQGAQPDTATNDDIAAVESRQHTGISAAPIIRHEPESSTKQHQPTVKNPAAQTPTLGRTRSAEIRIRLLPAPLGFTPAHPDGASHWHDYLPTARGLSMTSRALGEILSRWWQTDHSPVATEAIPEHQKLRQRPHRAKATEQTLPQPGQRTPTKTR